MLGRVLPLAALALLSLAAATAGAAEGGHGDHGIDIKTLGLQLLNFGVLVFVLARFGGRAINKALQGRHDQLKKDLDEATTARAAAEARLRQQEKRLSNLESEVTKLRASIKDEAEREQARLLAAAEEKARRLQDEARFLMDQQVKEAQIRFRQEVAATALQIAEDVIRKSLQPTDESRLAAGFVSDLERGPGKAPPEGRV
jgi:F-type H+-transporting ATPase subunit b